MNFKYLKTIILVLGLFSSQQVLADHQNFVLTATDSKKLGQGSIDELSDSIGQISITLQSREYSGSGVIIKKLAKSPTIGLRADRAMMAAKYKKHVLAELTDANGAKLACEINTQYGDIWGQCVNAVSQQILFIKN